MRVDLKRENKGLWLAGIHQPNERAAGPEEGPLSLLRGEAVAEFFQINWPDVLDVLRILEGSDKAVLDHDESFHLVFQYPDSLQVSTGSPLHSSALLPHITLLVATSLWPSDSCFSHGATLHSACS